MRRFASLLAVALAACSSPPVFDATDFGSLHSPTSTFSIVAFDPDTKELGIAVQSKFLGVGAVVPWAKAEVGAVATQAWANTTYGPEGLKSMAEGLSAEETMKKLLA